MDEDILGFGRFRPGPPQNFETLCLRTPSEARLTRENQCFPEDYVLRSIDPA
jgi:hypothetical protein